MTDSADIRRLRREHFWRTVEDGYIRVAPYLLFAGVLLFAYAAKTWLGELR